jgi:hypothetical protein
METNHLQPNLDSIQLVSVGTRRQLNQFVDFPWSIYRNAPHWVPPLRLQVKRVLSTVHNPFFKHARRQLWLAERGGKIVGRIAAIIDERHNQIHGEKTGFFGFFECIDDSKVSRLLLDQAAQWLKGQGMETARGPVNPSLNHEASLLVEGFDDSPTVMNTYNPPYYERLLQDAGFSGCKDLYAYDLKTGDRFSERLVKHAEKAIENKAVKLREIDVKDFEGEMARVLAIYNDAWEKNWGFVPMDEAEFRVMAEELRPILDPRFLLIAEVDGEPAGFALGLPDVNQALIQVRNGRLFPLGWAKLLWALKSPWAEKKITRIRIVTLGIKQKFQHLGLGPKFYLSFLKRGLEAGHDSGEASWILADNAPMNKALLAMGARKSKTYRIFERPL